MLRAIWSGSISFGLVGIPVKAVPAQSAKDIRFELLHGVPGDGHLLRLYPERWRAIGDAFLGSLNH